MIDWSRYKNFRLDEFKCSHTNKCDMHEDLLAYIQKMRDIYGKPIYISSGYRDVTHPVELMKDKPGEHTYGMACDIICYNNSALKLLKIAQDLGITRIGLHQKGRASGRFMHIGIADKLTNDFPSAIWTY